MVIGLDSFKKWFKGYEAYYALIGGTACDLLMDEAGLNFRATKDIDMVLISEALDAKFGYRFWEYVRTAGYEQRFKSTGKAVYYRFARPKSAEYPAMIELFSRRIEGITLPYGANLTPIPIEGNVSSLSAILLNDEYYHFLKSGLILVDGIPVLSASHMIPFKAKAWIDLTTRKASGEHVDSKDIRKHMNDAARLSDLLLPNVFLSLPDTIINDMQTFLVNIKDAARFTRIAAAFGLSKF